MLSSTNPRLARKRRFLERHWPWLLFGVLAGGATLLLGVAIDQGVFAGLEGFDAILRGYTKFGVLLGVAAFVSSALSFAYTLRKRALQERLLATTDAAQAVALEHVLVDVARRRDAARREARRALDRLDRERLREDVDQTIAAAIAPFIQQRVDPKREAWTLLQPCIEAAFADAPVPTEVADREAVHAVRIEAKRLRYAYDLLEPAFDDGRARKTLKLVQRRIGDARDRQLLADFVDEHRRALERDDRPRLAAGLAPLCATLRAEADAAAVHIAPALTRFDHAHIVAATQTALGIRPLTVVPEEALA